MAWQTGLVDVTSPDLGHVRALKHLMDFIRGSHVAAAAIAAGGSSYTVGDVLTIDAGTPFGDSNHVAQVEVIEEAAGVVTAVRLIQSGSFGVEPTDLTGVATTGGTGTGCTLDLTMDSWAVAVPDDPGAGYDVDDVVTVVGGAVESTAATFVVTAIGSDGAVEAVRLITAGDHSSLPANPAPTSGGTGAGLTLTITRRHWMIRTHTYADDETNFELIAEGRNESGANPFVGFRTGQPSGGAQWMLMGATGYSAVDPWISQPGHSPVDDFTSSTGGGSTRLPLTVSDIEFFFFVSGRRITVIAHIGATYEKMHAGLYLPYQDNPADKYPLPMVVAGTASVGSTGIATAEGTQHHILVRHQTGDSAGNGQLIRDVGGVWRTPATGSGASAMQGPWKLWPWTTSIVNEQQAFNVAAGSGTIGVPDAAAGSAGNLTDRFYTGDAGGVSGYGQFGIGNRTYLAEPYVFYQDEVGAVQLLGELDGIVSIIGRGVIAEELIEDQNGRQYQVFPNLSGTANDDFYAIARD